MRNSDGKFYTAAINIGTGKNISSPRKNIKWLGTYMETKFGESMWKRLLCEYKIICLKQIKPAWFGSNKLCSVCPISVVNLGVWENCQSSPSSFKKKYGLYSVSNRFWWFYCLSVCLWCNSKKDWSPNCVVLHLQSSARQMLFSYKAKELIKPSSILIWSGRNKCAFKARQWVSIQIWLWNAFYWSFLWFACFVNILVPSKRQRA